MHDDFDYEYPHRQTPRNQGAYQGIYQTGSTNPPKTHSRLITVLLIAVIFLGGIASALGILNIKLFRAMQEHPNGDDDLIAAFSNTVPEETEDIAAFTEPLTASIPTTGNISLDLRQSPASVENIPQEGGLSLQEIYTKAIDSVVSISCQSGSGTSSGTGVVLSADGYIVTNCHVVDGAVYIRVQLSDGQILDAGIIGTDAISDLAVLYVSASGLTPAEFGDSSVLRVGDTVAAIGDPLGVELRGTMTDGIVSAINRDIQVGGRIMTLIQTNAALNSGNSGGPLLNCYGQVIGINTMKIGDAMSSAGVEGLGFAIPSTTVKEIVDQLVSQGYVSGRPSLGVEGESVSIFYQMYYRLPEGLYLTEIKPGSQAETFGIQPGDILISIDGVRITSPDTFSAQLYSYQVGDTVEVIIYRGGRQYTLQMTLEESHG